MTHAFSALARLAIAAAFAVVPMRAAALEECSFSFDINAESSALQSIVEGAVSRGGFWRPIREAPDDVQDIGRYVGRLQICHMTSDGLPRQIPMPNGTVIERSVMTSTCTASLLPGNRLLTAWHCYYSPQLADIGFTIVREARVDFGYTDRDFIDAVMTFAVDTREMALDTDLDAMVLRIFGDANGRLGGAVPLVMEVNAAPRRAMTMIHHPNGDPQQFSDGTCQIDPRQAEVPDGAALLRHRCETVGGSSGALLLDARTLAVIGLHNAGGDDATNSGYKISAVEAALGLGFETSTLTLWSSGPALLGGKWEICDAVSGRRRYGVPGRGHHGCAGAQRARCCRADPRRNGTGASPGGARHSRRPPCGA